MDGGRQGPWAFQKVVFRLRVASVWPLVARGQQFFPVSRKGGHPFLSRIMYGLGTVLAFRSVLLIIGRIQLRPLRSDCGWLL